MWGCSRNWVRRRRIERNCGVTPCCCDVYVRTGSVINVIAQESPPEAHTLASKRSGEADPSILSAAITVATVVLLISIGLVVFEADLHVLMAAALLIVSLSAMSFARRTPEDIGRAMAQGIWEAKGALLIFVLIGALIAALMASGTVATLIDAGLRLIQPGWFLPAALVLCCLMSIATGTAWGTAGTAGVVLMGIGAASGLPLPLVAGVVVSGACFGDKMSPISDTTNLAAMAARTDLYQHIRSMVMTTGPTFVLVLIGYGLAGRYVGAKVIPADDLRVFSEAIESSYVLGWVTLIPLAVMVGLSLLRVDARLSMTASIVSAGVVAVLVQHVAVGDWLQALWRPAGMHTGVEVLDELFGRGGVTSMWWTLLLSLEALALGGVLSRFGYIRVLIHGMLGAIQRVGSLVSATIIGAFLCNIGMGEAYMSIILGGQLFREKYEAMGVDSAVLSRSLEEGATLTTPLIPWTTAGIFFAATLGVPTLSFLPYAWLNLLNPVVGIAFAYLGWGLWRHTKTPLKPVA